MVVGDVTTAVSNIIVGGGPGGYATAIRAAELGQSVVLVTDSSLGGTCLNRGCIPLKALVSAARRYHQTGDELSKTMGIVSEKPSLDWSQPQSWKQGIVNKLSGGISRLLAGHKIEVVSGLGWLMSKTELRVEGEYGSHRYAFEKCVIASGGSPKAWPDLPFGQNILTTSQALSLSELPAKLSIVGNDYIALELATLFQSFGTKVTLLCPDEQLMPDVDAVAMRLVTLSLKKLGVQIVTGVSGLKLQNESLSYQVSNATKQADLPCVVSNGVTPNVDKLNLKAANLTSLAVNAQQQTDLAHILAIGDCTGVQPALAAVALKQAKVAAEILAGHKAAYAPQTLPQVVHTTPELACVGYNAQSAKAAGYEVEAGRFPLAANGRALTLGSDNGVALVVSEKGSGLLLGMTIVSPLAGDLIMQAAFAIEMSATVTDLAEILYPHPSLTELTLESIESNLGLPIHIMPS